MKQVIEFDDDAALYDWLRSSLEDVIDNFDEGAAPELEELLEELDGKFDESVVEAVLEAMEEDDADAQYEFLGET
jgi:phytoene/squalene synthetase